MTDLRTLYDQRVADGSLTPDPAQEAVLPEFDRIRNALLNPEKKGFFKRAPEPPKGLYLWGGVGRGKSMLMDMFAGHMGDIPARRVHFHAFMQEIHSAMHEARKTGVDDAIAPVAASVAASVKVLAFDEMQITDITDAMIVGTPVSRRCSRLACCRCDHVEPDHLAICTRTGLNRETVSCRSSSCSRTKMVVHGLASPARLSAGSACRIALGLFHPTLTMRQSRAAMDAVWDGADRRARAQSSLTLRVKGRDVVIPRCFATASRARGSMRCAGSRWGLPTTFALAEACAGAGAGGISRRLGRDQLSTRRNAFVTLIDALYEAKAGLNCSASAAATSRDAVSRRGGHL